MKCQRMHLGRWIKNDYMQRSVEYVCGFVITFNHESETESESESERERNRERQKDIYIYIDENRTP